MRKIKIIYYELKDIIGSKCINYHCTDKLTKKGNLIHRVLATVKGNLEITYESSYDKTKDSDTFSEKLTMTECKDGWQLSIDSENNYQNSDDYKRYSHIFKMTLLSYLSGEHIFLGGIVESYKSAEYNTSSKSKPSNNDTLDDISKRLSVVEDWIYKQEANKFFDTLYNDLLSNKWDKYIKDITKAINIGQPLFDELMQVIVDLVEAGRPVPCSVIIGTGDYAEYFRLSMDNDKFGHINLN